MMKPSVFIRKCSLPLSRNLVNYRQRYTTAAADATLTPDFSLQQLHQRHFVYEDILSTQPTTLLKTALKTYLPAEEPTSDQTNPPEWLPLGFQHAYCRPQLSLTDLCDDGTDIKFLPGPQDIWKYRLWAGGSVTYHSTTPVLLGTSSSAILLERASDTRIIAKPGEASKVFVTIQRQFAAKTGSQSSEQLVSSLLDSGKSNHPHSSVFITEIENICFLRDPPNSLQDERRIKPPSNPTITHTMIPTRSLLFQFSALTYNAHSIHVDREFARKEYHAKDLVVHGPLTQVLMLEFLRRSLQRFHQPTSAPPMLRQADYNNLQPLYVDQPLTLCCQPISKYTGADPAQVQAWTVWIQKGLGENASLAVKATISVDNISEPKKS